MARCTPHPLLAVIAAALAWLAGCGHSDSAATDFEASELFALLEEQEMRFDSQAFVEVDLGKYRVTHKLPGDEGVLDVRFQLVAILPTSRQAKLDVALPHYQNRLRDAVIQLVQETDSEQLAEPSLAYFRAEIVSALNRVLQDRLIKDVVFSDFSVQRE